MNMSVDSPEEVIQRAQRQRAAREEEMQTAASRSIIREEESASARSMQFVVDGTQASSSSLSAPSSNNNMTTTTYSISSESESSLLNDNKPSMQCAEHKLPSERERVPQRNLLNIRGMKIDPLRISNTSSNTSGSSIDNDNMNVQRWCSAFYNGAQQQQQQPPPPPPPRRRSASMGGGSEQQQPTLHNTPPRRRSCESRRSSRAYDNNNCASSFVSATSYIGCEPVESVWGCYNTIGQNGLDLSPPPSRRRLSLFEVPVGLDLSRRNSIDTSTSPYLNRMMMNVQAHLSEATYNAGPLHANSIGDNSRYTVDSGPSGVTGILDQHASMNNWAAYSSSSSPGTTTEEEEEGGGGLTTTTTTDNDHRPEMMMMDDEDGSDYLDDDLSAEHYRRRSSYDSTSLRQQQNNLPHLATMKEEEEEENVHEQEDEHEGNEDEEEDMSQALVVRKVTGLDPEEASFAEKERAMEYTNTDEGQSQNVLVLHDNTPATHHKKKKRKSSTSKPPRVLVHHSQQKPPIDTSTRYNGYQHCFITIQEEHRFLMLYTFLKRNATRQNGHQKIIIFFSTTKSTQYYSRLLSKLKFNVRAVHNGMTRERFLQHYSDFVRGSSISKSNENGEDEEECAGSSSILCIPDFQGNDIAIPPSTNWLVQFEPPNNPSEYIFRVGRISSESKSSRINNKDGNDNGSSKEPPRALLFVTPQQFGFFKYYKAANVKIYEYEIPSIFKGVQKKITKIVQQEDVTGHHKLQLSKLGADAYHAYLCAYAGHDYKDIYNVKDLDVKKVALCFGFDVPPFNNMEKKKEEDGNEELGKIKKTWTPKKKKKIKWTTTRRGGSNDKNQADAEGADKKKKKKVSPAKSRANGEHNQWKPSKYEQNQWKPSKETLQVSSSWIPKGTKKTWRASRVHADKMKVDKQKSGREIVDEFKPKVVKLPRAG